jgi:hypothetical protein
MTDIYKCQGLSSGLARENGERFTRSVAENVGDKYDVPGISARNSPGLLLEVWQKPTFGLKLGVIK